MIKFKCKNCDSYEENIMFNGYYYYGGCYMYEIDVLHLYEEGILNPDNCKYFEQIEE